MVSQRTLSRSSEPVIGTHLNRDAHPSVRFHPGSPESGIIFIRSDLPDNPSVKCCLENLREQQRWTSLEQDNVWIHHTEHILAAIAGAGIDNVVVEVNTDRIPIVSGGSCADFYAALLRAGVREQNMPRQVFALRRPVYVEGKLIRLKNNSKAVDTNTKRYILGVPDDSFSVSYVFHVPGIDKLPIGFAEYHASYNSFGDYIGKARSYFLWVELDEISPLWGPELQDFFVLTPQSESSLVNEVAQHKILDFIGDLMVLGRPVLGRFVAIRSGHHHHHEFLREMINRGYLELKRLS